MSDYFVSNILEITPNDNNDFSNVSRCLWVGNGGNLSVMDLKGQVSTISNVPSGTLLPIRVIRVMATGTTASFIDIFW